MRLLTSIVAMALAIGAFVLPAAPKAVDASAVDVVFAPASDSGTLTPGQDLTLEGTITNRTGADIPAGTATVYLDRTAVDTPDDLVSWLGSDDDSTPDPGSIVAQIDSPRVPAGSPAQFSVVVAADSVGLSPASVWGARRLDVRITAGQTQLRDARTSIVWSPDASEPVTHVAVAMPITVPHGTEGLIPADTLEKYTQPGGLLTNQLDEAADGAIALGVDPLVIASIAVLGTTAPDSVSAWLDRLRSMYNDTFPLAYADADLAGMSQAIGRILAPTSIPVDPSVLPTLPTPTPTGTATSTPTPTSTPGAPATPSAPTPDALMSLPYSLGGIAWPSDLTVVGADLATFAKAKLTTTILDSGNVSYGDLKTTPSANARIGDSSVVVSDSAVSSLLRQAAAAPTQVEWERAMAGLSGAIATISREHPDQQRTILATLGRNAPGSDYFMHSTMTALSALPWASGASFKQLVAGTLASPVTATIAAHPESAGRTAAIAADFAVEGQLGQFSAILSDPTVLTGPRRLELLALLGNGWLELPTWTAAAAKYQSDSNAILSSVSVATSGTQLLTATRINLHVTVANTLEWPVTVSVWVTLASPKSILVVEKRRVEMTIEASSQSTAMIPVQAVANGTGEVTAALTTPQRSGAADVPISSPKTLEVDVSAGWETGVTAVLAILVVLVFAFGVWRNIARRRKARRGAVDDDADGDDNTEADDAGDAAGTGYAAETAEEPAETAEEPADPAASRAPGDAAPDDPATAPDDPERP